MLQIWHRHRRLTPTASGSSNDPKVGGRRSCDQSRYFGSP